MWADIVSGAGENQFLWKSLISICKNCRWGDIWERKETHPWQVLVTRGPCVVLQTTLASATINVNNIYIENILATQGPKCSIFTAVLSSEWELTGLLLQQLEDHSGTYPPKYYHCKVWAFKPFFFWRWGVAVMSKAVYLTWNVHKE